MSTRARNILRSLGAMAVLAGIVIGIPIVLVAIAGWPLPTKVPDFDHVSVALRQGDLPAAVVVKTIAVVVWLVWVQLAWAVAFEFSTAVRSGRGQNRARPAPLVTTALGVGMSRLVAMALSIGIATSTITTSLARAGPAAAAVAAGPPPRPATAALDAPLWGAPITATGRQWLVEKGDTCWDIAEIALGDGARVNEILELNPALGSPRHLHVGRILSLPVDAHVPADRVPVAAAPEPPAEPATALVVAGGYLAGKTITIQRGDSVWNLAEQRLDVADGPVDTPTATDIADYLEDVITTSPPEAHR
jgi:LysM domain